MLSDFNGYISCGGGLVVYISDVNGRLGFCRLATGREKMARKCLRG